MKNEAESIADRVNALPRRKARRLEKYKSKLWDKVSAYMEKGEFEGTDRFNFHMQTWVENMARNQAKSPEDRELVLLASDIIQVRFWTVMNAAIKGREAE